MWQTFYITMKMYIYAPKQRKAYRIGPPNGGPYPNDVPQPEDEDVRMKQEEEWIWMSYLMSL